MLGMIRHRIAAIAATTVAVLGIVGIGIAYADSTVNVPNANGQLTGTVWICVNTANEGQQYVELKHPAPGNCAAGYLQYQANQVVPSSSSPPAPNVNSESFTAAGSSNHTGCAVAAAAFAVKDSFCVSLPAGSHLVGTPTILDEPALTATTPVTATAVTDDAVTGQVNVTFSAAPTAGDTIQITYDYQL